MRRGSDAAGWRHSECWLNQRGSHGVSSKGKRYFHFSGKPVYSVDKSALGGSIVALLVTKWGLAMSKDEEISGPGTRDFGLASQVEWESN